MSRFIALNCATNYFFSPRLGQMLGITEAEPDLVLTRLMEMQKGAISHVDPHFLPLFPFSLSIQVNSREFFFRDESLLAEIAALFHHTHSRSNPTDRFYLSIHQANDQQPFPDKPTFLPELLRNCKLAREWGCPNITVHLPVRDQDDTALVVATLTHPDLLQELAIGLADHAVSIDLENNHHNSYFGNLEHVDAFLTALDQRLVEIGHADLIPCFNLCFDFGHYLSQSYRMGYDQRGMLHDFFVKRGSRIHTFHIHVNDGSWDDHFLLTHHVDAENKIGGKVIMEEPLHRHRQILLDSLKLLHLKDRDDWILVTETETPFTVEELAGHWQLILSHL